MTIITIIIIIILKLTEIIASRELIIIMFKKSKQRDGVLKVLSKKNYHPTVEEIYEVMKKKFHNIGIATVYRNIEQLIQMGKIAKIDIPGGPSQFEGHLEEHFHIKCTECGKVSDVWLDYKLEDHIEINTAIPGYKLSGYKIDFWGTCNICNRSH